MPRNDCHCGGLGWDGCHPENRNAVALNHGLQDQIEADLLAEMASGTTLERVLSKNLRAAIVSGARAGAAGAVPLGSSSTELLATKFNSQRRSFRSAERHS